MRILVAVASRHGATREIAERIAIVLRDQVGEEPDGSVHVRDAAEVQDVAGYDAYVIGSAVYMGRWLDAARDFVERHADAFAGRPTWIFSSGPIGEPPKPVEESVDATEIAARTRARDHRVFAGRLDRSGLGFAERAVAAALRAPYGDFRDWNGIEAWGRAIADSLLSPVA
jgi:menaquinone-dependent protoporphyrinogen oxidase